MRFLLIFFVLYCSAQNNSQFIELSINGIPFNKNINCIHEDNKGFLWLGTNNGLYRYDGHSLKQYKYNVFDENSIPNNNINSIIEDDFGNLWLGSESYLILYNINNNSFKGYYRDKTATVLGKTTDGKVWAFLQNVGLIKITSAYNIKDVVFNTTDNQQSIISYCQDAYNRHWFATDKGVIAITKDNKVIKTSFKKDVIAINSIEQNIFLATTNTGIYILEYNSENYSLKRVKDYDISHFPKTYSSYTINAVTINKTNGTIWLGTDHGLLVGTKKDNTYKFEFSNVLKSSKPQSNNLINSVLIDRYNNVWAASQHGVLKLIDKALVFDYKTLGDDVENRYANLIFPENDNNQLATFNGQDIYRFNTSNNKKEVFLRLDNKVTLIKENPKTKQLFIGSGRMLFQTKNYSQNKTFPLLDTLKTYKKSIQDIVLLDSTSLWVGLWGNGVDVINLESKATSDFEKKVISTLSKSNVFVMQKDSKGNIWIGTRGTGLFRIDTREKAINHFKPKKVNGITSNGILSIKEATDGHIWIGTRGGGLNRYSYSNDRFTTFSKSDGLHSTTIAGIEEDNNGNIWLSTQNGLSFLDVSTNTFINFDANDGVSQSQFAFNSHAKLNNRIFFGTVGGFYQVSPEKFKTSDQVTTTAITDFSIFGNEANDENLEVTNANLENALYTKKIINLPHYHNNIVINFSSLDLTNPTKNLYAYKLEGVNDYWIHTNASNRNANYNNLPPGHYTFNVKSTNSFGVWNETPTQMSFYIKPPFWKSNTAFIMYFLLAIILIALGFYLIRKWYHLKQNLVAETVSRQKDNEHHKMRMVFFTDISHELRTPLTLIKGAIEKVVSEKNHTITSLTAQRIYNNAIRMTKLINQIMDIRKHDVGKFKLKVAKNNIVNDVHKIKSAFNDLSKINEVIYTFDCKHDTIEAWYDAQILEKILFNLLSNAFKYTPRSGTVKVTLEELKLTQNDKYTKALSKGKYIKCTVSDTGIGISENDINLIFNRFYQTSKVPTNQVPGTGVGMELVHKLVKLHKGSINVKSKEFKLTEFVFYLPIRKKDYSKSEIVANNQKPNVITLNDIERYDFTKSAIEKESTQIDTTGKPKVLLVEDNQELLNMVAERLSKDFKIITAKNGKQGYDKVLKYKPKLVLSDISMPIEDGISMLKRIKANKQINHIPVFMLTAKGSEETKIECLRIGAYDFIEKPFSFEFVRWKIKNTLFTRRNLKERFSRIISAKPSEVDIESRDEKLIRKLVAIIENYIDDDLLSVEYLASEVGMSRASLYRKLQAITGETPVDFIKKIRLERAVQLLKQDTLYISEIAHMTGFNNQKYFSKCFKKEYGVSPTEYLKKEEV